MSYESPVKLVQTEPFIEHLRDETDNMIYRAVIHADVDMDREELIKALEYDRGQYEKGYADGLSYKPPINTNADRIRAMSDEELATTFYNGCGDRSYNDACRVTQECVKREILSISDEEQDAICIRCWLDWLKSPVEVDDE